jgi:hypothetical protein
MFLIAHVLHSAGQVLAFGVAFLLSLSLFWVDLTALTTLALTGGDLTGSFGGTLFISQLAAPPQFPSVVAWILTGEPPAGLGSTNFPTGWNAAVAVGSAGALWLALPLAGTYWYATHRD